MQIVTHHKCALTAHHRHPMDLATQWKLEKCTFSNNVCGLSVGKEYNQTKYAPIPKSFVKCRAKVLQENSNYKENKAPQVSMAAINKV